MREKIKKPKQRLINHKVLSLGINVDGWQGRDTSRSKKRCMELDGTSKKGVTQMRLRVWKRKTSSSSKKDREMIQMPLEQEQ